MQFCVVCCTAYKTGDLVFRELHVPEVLNNVVLHVGASVVLDWLPSVKDSLATLEGKSQKLYKLNNLTYKSPENTGGSGNVNYNRLTRWGRWGRDGDQD